MKELVLTALFLLSRITGAGAVKYQGVDAATFEAYSSNWKSSHESWIGFPEEDLKACRGSPSFPVCVGGAILGSHLPVSSHVCPKLQCWADTTCVATPQDTIEYTPPQRKTSLDEPVVCSPPTQDAELFSPYYGMADGLAPDFTPLSAVRYEITGRVSAAIGGQCQPVAGAEVEAWQLDVTALPEQVIREPRAPSTAKDATADSPAQLRALSCRGSVITGADGAFHLTTTLPPSFGPPRHVSFVVRAKNLETLTTRMYIQEDWRLQELTSLADRAGVLAQDPLERSRTPGAVAHDPRVVHAEFVNTTLPNTAGVSRGYFRSAFNMVLRPLREPEEINEQDHAGKHVVEPLAASAHAPMNLSGLWSDRSGDLYVVETYGYTFIAAEFPHTRRFGTVVGALRGDTVTGVSFRAYRGGSAKDDPSISRPQTSLQGERTAATAVSSEDKKGKMDLVSVEAGLGRLEHSGVADSFRFADQADGPGSARGGALSTGVVVNTDPFTTAIGEATIRWAGGGYEDVWSRKAEQQGWRYLKLAITRETGPHSGGEVRINELIFFQGAILEQRWPSLDRVMRSPRTPAPQKVTCSSFRTQEQHCWKAFDGDAGPDAGWVSNRAGSHKHALDSPHWVLLDLGPGRGAAPTGLRIVCDSGRSEAPGSCPMTFELLGSKDGVRFETLYSQDLFDYHDPFNTAHHALYATDSGETFYFAWEAPAGRTDGHRCGSCDAAPFFTCALDGFDGTCASTHCSARGVCGRWQQCPAGQYMHTPLHTPAHAHDAPAVLCLPCPPSRYGSEPGLTSPGCSGPCAPGHWCPAGSTRSTQYRCSDNVGDDAVQTQAQVSAGNRPARALFCPGGSAQPLLAPAGRKTVPLTKPPTDVSALRHDTGVMVGTEVCDPGNFCVDGEQRACPLGTFGNASGLATPECSGRCIAGEFCPEGSVVPTLCARGDYCPDGRVRQYCPAGRYGIARGLADRACSGTCAKGYFCSSGSTSPTQERCPPGRYGATLEMRDAFCSGECQEGYFCPPLLDPARPLPLHQATPNTNDTAYPCSGPHLYCPRGSELPLPVKEGYYSAGGLPNTRTHQLVCPRGFFCVRGEKFSCPAGWFGEKQGMTSPNGFSPKDEAFAYPDTAFPCSGLCAKGHFCPKNSSSETERPCPAGRYGTTRGLRDSLCTATCPVGHYCPAGSVTPTPCPAGLHGNTTGLTSTACAAECPDGHCAPASCQEGYFCPEGSVSRQERTCGGAHLFCPTGSALPTPVSLGYYSTGPSPIEKDDPERRTGQKKCPAGSFCEMGIKRTCPPGVFGATAGLQNASCTDVCPKGYYCPEGSVNGTLRRCPSGRYGTSEGLTDRACTGRCHEGYYCPEGSTSPTQHQCSQPVPTTRYWTPDTTAEGRTSAPPPEELQTPPRSDAVFCPLGSAVPTVVLPGHYSLGQDRHTRTGQARCPPGSFCRAGIIYDCPPGRYGKAWELASAECTGPCARGYYCPVGSTESTQVACPAGRYGAVEGLGSIACSGACPRPSHCPQASVLKVRASTESRPDIF